MASYKRKTVRTSKGSPQFHPVFSKVILVQIFIISLMIGIGLQSFAAFFIVLASAWLYFKIPLSDAILFTSISVLWSIASGAFSWLMTALVEDVLELNTYYMPVIIPMIWSFMASMRRQKQLARVLKETQ